MTLSDLPGCFSYSKLCKIMQLFFLNSEAFWPQPPRRDLLAIGDESVSKIIINNTIDLFFL